MRKFTSRNVLDRLEDTFKRIFNSNWKSIFPPFLILLAVNIAGGILAVIIVPLFLVLGTTIETSELGKIVIIILLALILIIGIVTFYWITGNLASITTYLIFQKQEKKETFTPTGILLEAKRYLPHALGFDGYFYSTLALVVLVLFMLLFPYLQGNFAILFHMASGGTPDWDILSTMLLQFLGIGAILGTIYLGFSFWFSARYMPWKPGYILGQQTGLTDFRRAEGLTEGNLWNIIGNMLVLTIIISLVTGVWNNVIGGLFGGSGISLPTEALQGQNMDEILQNLPTLLTMISPGPIGGSMIVSLISGMLVSIFRNGFAYFLYQDLSTEIAEEKSGE